MRKKVLIPLLTVILVTLGSFYFFIDSVIQRNLINLGQNIAKAKVEIESTSLSLSPFGLEIKGLKIADKDNPMTNLVDIKELAAKIHFSPLLKKKIIIETIRVNNLMLKTPRKKSGALPSPVFSTSEAESKEISSSSKSANKPSSPKKEKKSLDLSFLTKKSDPKQLLNKRELSLTKASSKLKSSVNEKQNYWKDQINNLNFESELKELNTDAGTLDSLSISSIDDLKKLPGTYKKISNILNGYGTLLNTINTKQNEFSQDITLINNAYTTLSQSSDKDYREIVAELDVDHTETQRISAALMGQPLTEKLSGILSKIQTIKNRLPRLSHKKPTPQQREKGQDIHFKITKNPLPFLWIKSVTFSGDKKTNTSGYITDITSHQDLVGKITRFHLQGFTKKKSVYELKGTLNFLKNNSLISIQYNDKNAALSPLSLIKGKEPITIQNGRINTSFILNIDDTYSKGYLLFEGYNLSIKETYAKNTFSLSSILSQSLTTLSPTTVKSTFSGKLTSPKLSIESNIDSHIQKEISRLTQVKINQTKAALKSEINAQLLAQQNQLKPLINSFSDYGNTLNKTQKSISTQKDTILNKERDLKKKENKVKEKAAAPIKKEQEKIEKALKNQFKNLF